VSRQSNLGLLEGERVRQRHLSREADMNAYDRLPEPLRRQLGEMSMKWDATGVRDILAGHGADIAGRVLAKTERDMQAAYRERIGL
jgi:hypothetical protein